MKKLLAFVLVLGLASLANAAVINVETDGLGSLGHAGTVEDKLDIGETIKIKLTLGNNPFIAGDGNHYSDYDGYFLDSFDVNLGTTANGSLADEMQALPFPPYTETSQFGSHADFSTLVRDGAAGRYQDLSISLIGPGEVDIIWGLELTALAGGVIDVTIEHYYDANTQSTNYGQYKDLSDVVGGAMQIMDDDSLASLGVHVVPEPMTMSLLGLGAFGLIRRRR